MVRRGMGVLLLSLIFIFVGSEDGKKIYINEIKDGWVDVSTEWTDVNDSQLSYVDDGTDIWIDLGWYTDPLDLNTWIMGYIEEYTYTEGKLTGKYTSHQNLDLSKHSITITFSYASPKLTAVVVAGGVLANKTLVLTQAP